MNDYVSLFTPFWKAIDVLVALVGIVLIVRPSPLLEPFPSALLSRWPGQRLGLPFAARSALLALIDRRAQALYGAGPARLIGAACVAAGIIGLATSVAQPILFAALNLVFVASTLVVLRQDSAAARPVPWWIVAAFVLEASALALVGTVPALVTALATLLCAAAFIVLRFLPEAQSCGQAAHERDVDRWFRSKRVAVLTVLTALPPILCTADPIDHRTVVSAARLIVLVCSYAISITQLMSSRRSDLELQRTLSQDRSRGRNPTAHVTGTRDA